MISAPSRANDSAMANARLHLFATPAMTAVFPSSSFDMNLIEYLGESVKGLPSSSAPRTHSDRCAHYLRVPLPVALCAGRSHGQPTLDSSSCVEPAGGALSPARHHRQRGFVYPARLCGAFGAAEQPAAGSCRLRSGAARAVALNRDGADATLGAEPGNQHGRRDYQ